FESIFTPVSRQKLNSGSESLIEVKVLKFLLKLANNRTPYRIFLSLSYIILYKLTHFLYFLVFCVFFNKNSHMYLQETTSGFGKCTTIRYRNCSLVAQRLVN